MSVRGLWRGNNDRCSCVLVYIINDNQYKRGMQWHMMYELTHSRAFADRLETGQHRDLIGGVRIIFDGCR